MLICSKLGLPITDETEIVLIYFDLIEDLRKSLKFWLIGRLFFQSKIVTLVLV